MSVKMEVKTDFFDNCLEAFEELGRTDQIKHAVSSGLKSAKAKINEDIKKALIKSNMPREGIYSTGRSKSAIDKDFNVKWHGTKTSITVGFDWKDRNIGLGTQVMIYGTPSQKPITGLKEAIYSAKNDERVKKECQEAIDKVVERVMNK